ncbi:hypothetical protein HW555_014095 [Spodoptera exigua]|uniref:ABC transmembrane type-1 domain-containing protein n=1 Tax=Spodoptera exigua TaxID=7107 RepID=A0A835G0A4_SPOEX|nr:hypothetical protein HW555_014095 [Spodoptera exigua]
MAFVKAFDRSNEQEMAAGATLNASIIESLEGIETIKAYNGEDKVYNKIDQQFNIINLQVKMQTAQVANRRLNEIFYIEPEQIEGSQTKNITSKIFNDGITVDNVSFSYGMKAPVLQAITTSIL